ncbi:prepilin-type N-terminal cleavage/methylation domain-containing protein [Lampropedia aestuarii]|uniref:Prepilin-type N-terminal cleavage/methylation domain-containing protein n=1 Tax=Lampropedia aestuarii TaxID=2562762 RepID=A0A4V3YXP8_9BURK|nr:prepilin-type N-terminal cleavage/methylation domain-containing protein [Lampropedia aestuarii]MDH5857682.1 prepilin-type N-terminal cleavage/methylation domain-containing protein [Lampropedia aestuarii]THJ36032.1 prepilin-type N-terminal cleavage/methylation domain-containing protein [Lampropedia aestuarii]
MSYPSLSMARHAPKPRLQQGFTLIEVLVAMVIMAMGLALLYQILGTNTQAVSMTSQYQRAAMLGQSLLAAHDAIPESGWNAQGQSGGYSWSARTQPYQTSSGRQEMGLVPLHQLNIDIQWQENGNTRALNLATLKPQRYVQGTAREATPAEN